MAAGATVEMTMGEAESDAVLALMGSDYDKDPNYLIEKLKDTSFSGEARHLFLFYLQDILLELTEEPKIKDFYKTYFLSHPGQFKTLATTLIANFHKGDHADARLYIVDLFHAFAHEKELRNILASSPDIRETLVKMLLEAGKKSSDDFLPNIAFALNLLLDDKQIKAMVLKNEEYCKILGSLGLRIERPAPPVAPPPVAGKKRGRRSSDFVPEAAAEEGGSASVVDIDLVWRDYNPGATQKRKREKLTPLSRYNRKKSAAADTEEDDGSCYGAVDVERNDGPCYESFLDQASSSADSATLRPFAAQAAKTDLAATAAPAPALGPRG